MLKKMLLAALSFGSLTNAIADTPGQCPPPSAYVYSTAIPAWTFVDQSMYKDWVILSPKPDSTGISTMKDSTATNVKVTTAYWLSYGTKEIGIKDVTCTYALSGDTPLLVKSTSLSNYTFATESQRQNFQKDGPYSYTCLANADALDKCNWKNRLVSYCAPGKKKCESLMEQQV